MECFRKFKAVFCLVSAFMFMFGNAFFVQAAIEYEEVQLLRACFRCGDEGLKFIRLIAYTYSDPYTNKTISKVNEVVLDLAPDDLDLLPDGSPRVSFVQEGVHAQIVHSGKEVRGFVDGTLKETMDCCEVDFQTEISTPFVYHLPKSELQNSN